MASARKGGAPRQAWPALDDALALLAVCDAALDWIADGYRPVRNAKSRRVALVGRAASETRVAGGC